MDSSDMEDMEEDGDDFMFASEEEDLSGFNGAWYADDDDDDD